MGTKSDERKNLYWKKLKYGKLFAVSLMMSTQFQNHFMYYIQD